MTRLLGAFAVNLAVLALGIVLLELAFGNWFAAYLLPDPRMVDQRITFHQTLYAPESDVVYVRDKYGLRGVNGPVESAEVVTLGGSTTNQLFITEGSTWQDVIHSQTGIVVANAGVDAMSALTHPLFLEEWLHAIPGMHAKWYVHYVGVNDALLDEMIPLYEAKARSSWSRGIRARSAILTAIARVREWAAKPIIVNHNALNAFNVSGP